MKKFHPFGSWIFSCTTIV